jgi:hypothetical protein
LKEPSSPREGENQVVGEAFFYLVNVLENDGNNPGLLQHFKNRPHTTLQMTQDFSNLSCSHFLAKYPSHSCTSPAGGGIESAAHPTSASAQHVNTSKHHRSTVHSPTIPLLQSSTLNTLFFERILTFLGTV